MENMNVFFLAFNVLLMVFLMFFLAIVPLITRKSLLFGVRVPEDTYGHEEVRGLRRGYIMVVVSGGIAAIAISVLIYAVAPEYSLLVLMYLPLIMIALQFAAFLPRWKKAKELKEINGWAVSSATFVETRSAAQREKLSVIPWGWYGLNLLLFAGVFIWSLALYPTLPDTLVLHWNAQMQPDRWSDKSFWTVSLMPLVSLGFTVVMAASNIFIYRMKLQISVENPSLSFAQHKLYRRMLSHALGFITLCINIYLLFIQIMTLNVYVYSSSVFLIGTVALMAVVLIPLIFVPVKAGQGGCRLKPVIAEAVQPKYKPGKTVLGRGDDKHWKLGMFYYNPDDPAILVEDRFGAGNSGFNYARLVSKIFIISILVLMVVAYAVTTVWFLAYYL